MGDTDFPVVMANYGRARDKATAWKESGSQSQDYFQTGSDIPTFGEGSGGSFMAGSNIPTTGNEYQYLNPGNLASTGFGGAPNQPVPEGYAEKMNRTGTPAPSWLREKLFGKPNEQQPGQGQLPQASGMMEQPFNIAASFEIPKAQGALGKRSGEQLLRLQDSGLQNQQLQQELERRGMMPRGLQLPPV